jgi:hypothetical protein
MTKAWGTALTAVLSLVVALMMAWLMLKST